MSRNTSRLRQFVTQAKPLQASVEDLDPQLKATVADPLRVIEPNPDHIQEAADAYQQLETSSEEEDREDFHDTVEGLESLCADIKAANEDGGLPAESAYFAGIAMEAYSSRLGLSLDAMNDSLESAISSEERSKIDISELVQSLEGVDNAAKQFGKRWVASWHRLFSLTVTRVKVASMGLDEIVKKAQGLKDHSKSDKEIFVKRSYVIEGDKVPKDIGTAFSKAADALKYLTGPFAKQAAQDFRYNGQLLEHSLDDVLDGKVAKWRTAEVDEAFLKQMPKIWAKWRDPRKKLKQDPTKPIIGNFVFFENHSLKYNGSNDTAKKFDKFANHGYPTLITYQHGSSGQGGDQVIIKALTPSQIASIAAELKDAAKNVSLFRGFVEFVANSPLGFTLGAPSKLELRDIGDKKAAFSGYVKLPELKTVRDAANTSNRLCIHTCYDAGRALAITIRHFKKIAKLSLKAHAQASMESWDQATASDGVSVNETASNEPRQAPGKANQAPEGEVVPHQDTFQDKPESRQNLDGPVKSSSEGVSPIETFGEPAEKKDEKADGIGAIVAAVKGGKPDTDQIQKDAALRGAAPTGYKEKAASDSDKASDDEKDTPQGVHAAKANTDQSVSGDAALRKPAVESVQALPYWFKG